VDNLTERWKHWIPVLENELIVEMQKAPSPCEMHGRDHIARVLKRSISLGQELNADLEVLVAAVYLHDLGIHYVLDKAHGVLGAIKAEPVLERISFPGGKRDAVLCAIRLHDTTAKPDDRTTLESKILYDADKIDAFGVIGILRYLRVVYGKVPIDFIIDDIDARWAGLTLPHTRNIALKGYTYIKDYFVQLKDELNEA
jgi:HD superfamily phosphodiesterase